MIRFLSALRHRLPARGDDTGSMPMALLLTLIGVALGALMVPIIVTQDHATTYDNTRVHELHAAEAGFEVALGQIRTATDTGGNGVTANLPCGPISGTVDAAATDTYTVTFAYYTQNPVGHTASWLSDSTNKMACVNGYGTYLHATNEFVPSFVLLTSSGTVTTGSATASRTLQSTYIVQTTNENISGGTIAIYPQSNGMCMAAAWSNATTPPTAGTAVQLEPCETDQNLLKTAPSNQSAPGPWPWQVWSYRDDLSIQLVSSDSTTNPNGMCIDATTPHSSTSTVVLEPCATAGSAPYNQEWSIDDSSHLEGSKSDESDIDGYCINVANQNAGTALTLKTCAGGTTDQSQTWVPSPNAGAGMAGASNNQVVNFQQFGRCLDVTNQSVSGDGGANPGGNNYLIAYTCKQDPNPSKVAWNQKFTLNSYGEYVTKYQGTTNYCMKSPLGAYSSSTPGPYVNVVTCPAGAPAANSGLIWTTNGTSDSLGNALPYSDKFTVIDSKGYCLTVTQGSGDTYIGYSKVIVATCDGETDQKWNAQADLQDPELENTIELSRPPTS